MKKILLVEDSASFRESLKGVLRANFPRVQIVEAGDGQEAFRQMTDPIPDVVIMDIGLPGENGLVLTSRIKDQHPQVAVIILTNYDLAEYREAALRSRADHYLLKTTPLSELIAAIAPRLSDNEP
jgi:DNA-binding NarL/FixJ family response regulator